MGDPTGFLKHGPRAAHAPAGRPCGCATGRRSTSTFPRRQLAGAGRPLHGLRHPVLPQRLPAGQPHPGLERPRLPRPTGARPSSGCTPPTTSPSSPAGSAPRRARPPACSASTTTRSRSSRSRSRSSTARGTRAGCRRSTPTTRTGKKVAVVGSGPAGLAAAQQLTRAGHDVIVFERADRIGGLLRYGIPEFKMEKRHLDRRLDQMAAEGTGSGTGVDVGTDVTAERAARASSTPSCWPAGPPPARPARARAASSRASTRPWSTCRGQPGAAGRPRRAADHRRGQARRDHRRRRHRRRLPRAPPTARAPRRSPSWRSCRAAGRAHRVHPVADLPADLPLSSAHEEGGERLYSVNTECFLGDDDGKLRALRAARGASWSTAASSRSRAPSASCLRAGAAGHGLRRPGARAAARRARRRARPSAATSRATTLHDQRRRRLRRRRHGPRPVPDRVGHRRGPGRGGRVDALPHRPHRAPPPDQPDGPAAPEGTHDRDHRHTTPVGTGLMCHSTRSLPCEALHHRGERFVRTPR